MRIKYFWVLLILALLAFEGFSQRGGGRRRSFRRRYRSSFRSGRGGQSFLSLFASLKKGSQNSTDIFEFLFGSHQHSNGTDYFDHTLQNGCKIQDSNPWITLGWIGGTFILGLLYLCRGGRFQYGNDPNHQFKRITDHLEEAYEINWNFARQQKIEAFEKLTQRQWKVQIRVGFQRKVQKWDLRIKSLAKKKEYVYEIEGQGFNDQNGDSVIKGIVLYGYKRLKICFRKQYLKRQASQKIGKWDLLIYKGYINDNKIEGRWYFYGWVNDLRYSGSMKMASQ